MAVCACQNEGAVLGLLHPGQGFLREDDFPGRDVSRGKQTIAAALPAAQRQMATLKRHSERMQLVFGWRHEFSHEVSIKHDMGIGPKMK